MSNRRGESLQYFRKINRIAVLNEGFNADFNARVLNDTLGKMIAMHLASSSDNDYLIQEPKVEHLHEIIHLATEVRHLLKNVNYYLPIEEFSSASQQLQNNYNFIYDPDKGYMEERELFERVHRWQDKHYNN